ncbi:plant UBX domain-containing protein 9 isoform X1 [Cucurbita moschata]|uniref:Plant UBX domain-containing protein 9 isoform X1 n=1 Tax=Cucurbita moschata TaxID=3662 RepID=A0A6J1FNU1_CUCMO|nr:plant UBX domain-containing protein 9 isoform X1 [Cucurbita moschata]
MAWPDQEAVETFMRITGASESLALRKLEEYRGDINAAVNAHFSEGYSFNRYVAPTIPEQNNTNANGGSQGGQYGLSPLLNAARSFSPSSLLDPNYRRHLFDQMRRYPSFGPPSSSSHPQPGGMGSVPSGFNSLLAQPSHQAWRGTFEGENHSSSFSNQKTERDTEDEMLRAAIEASKQDSDAELLQRQLQREDDDLAHAVSLSLRIAEQEKAVRELMPENKDEASSIGRGEPSNSGPKESKGGTTTHHQPDQDPFYPNESLKWGGINSKELSEAVLLESAIFGGVSEDFSENSVPASHLQNDKIQGTSKGTDLQPVPCFSIPSSSTEQSQQQQKDTGRNLAVQEAPFPPEPEIDNKDSVTLLLRMPDGRCHQRRFLYSDRLQLLFNFIADKLAMQPGTYKVVRPYPRCAFGVEDGSMMLRDLGLTGKHEALYVEII